MANNQNGERTEKPTAKKQKDARERGQIARSRDLTSAVSLAVAALALSWFGASMLDMISTRLAAGLSSLADRAHAALAPAHVIDQLWADAGLLARVSGPPALLAGFASVAASVAQVGWGWAPKALEISWERLSPVQGFAKFKPVQAGSETVKAIVGMTIVGYVAYVFARDFYIKAPGLVGMAPLEGAWMTWDMLWRLLWQVGLALVVLGALDFGFQYWRWFQQLKMTRKDVLDEARQNDGRPEVKARIRRIQRDLARNQMLKAVETATVVVTNPTHFAVALKYTRGEMAAPVVVAKGRDHMAARIREIARTHEVPMVENVSLARALYKAVDIGDSIPADLFGAVAEVLAYLVRLKKLML